MERIGRVLLRADEAPPALAKLLIGEDLFALADRDVAAAVKPAMERAARVAAKSETVKVFRGDPAHWCEAFRLLQSREAWEADGAWIARAKPTFGPDVAERFEFASRVTDADLVGPRKLREDVATHMAALLAGGAVLCLPTSPVPAPQRDASFETLGDVRLRTMAMACVAGLARLPQISIPAGTVGGAPVGFSLIGARGSDMTLLALARAIAG
jgi:amidase